MHPSDDVRVLTALWRDAVTIERDAQTKALIAGMNFRLNLAKAFEAAYKTAKAYLKTKQFALSGGTDLMAGIEAAQSGIGAVACALNAFAEQVHELVYVGCMVLSESPDGLEVAAFEQRLREFLDQSRDQAFPWYTGLTTTRLAAARDALDGQSIDALVTRMETDGLVTRTGTKITYTPKNFVLGFLDG